MNIFYLNHNPEICARNCCDKHCVKMILEYAQLMSSAHRYLDGVQTSVEIDGKIKNRWILPDERESQIYQVAHLNHPSTIWTRSGEENYLWLYSLWIETINEYKYRYNNKLHSCERLREPLSRPPFNIEKREFFEPTQAMPEYCKIPGDSISAYRKYYINEKQHLAKWSKRDIPEWFEILPIK